MVTGNTYRNPALLAKLAVTVDHLSGGRLEFGIGAAWAAIEHSMYGIEGLDHRVGRLSESLRIIRSLWTEERTNFDGRYYKMTDAIANPKPIQKPYPPIWIGASGETTIRLVARYADVWNTGAAEIDKGTAVITRLEDACGAVGRDPSEIRRSIQFAWDGQDRSRLLEQSARYLELGFTEQIFMLDPAKATMLAGKLAEALPELRNVGRVRK
jgi:alkanesulfonate monooxygenase SsuD/methylene tetrahydromethanopterin reductase-like flavin-dependent oxidoreductase (luciferase family)